MTPRSSVAREQRPLSAIYIGSLGSISSSTPPDLPRLPEPPDSPEGSPDASRSGLPSPPATNSTGSGDSNNAGSLRKRLPQRTFSITSDADMYHGHNKSEPDVRATANATYSDDDDDDPNNDNENDEDMTARFDSLSRRRSAKAAAAPREDNISALQRVKSLTERNRLVLNKLSSISRFGSPSPAKPPRSPLSPPPNVSSPLNTSRASTSRPSTSMHNQQASASYARSHLYHTQGNSGSETERESRRQPPYTHAHSSSDSMSNTPTSSYSEFNPPFSSSERQFLKVRRLSEPPSPARDPDGRLLDRDKDSTPPPSAGPSQTRTPRKRASLAIQRDSGRRGSVDDDQDDVMSAALAAVASSRAESLGASSGGKRSGRQALPLEFRNRDRGDDDEPVPSTPNRDREFYRSRRSPSPAARATTSTGYSNLNGPDANRSPRKHAMANGRDSTVRDLTRKHQTRWLSEDLTAQQLDAEEAPGTPHRSSTSHSNYASGSGYGRRQSTRAGSIDTPLSPGRRILDEGLRAAGLSKKRDPGADDVFAQSQLNLSAPKQTKRTRSTGAHSGDGHWDSPVQITPGFRLGGPPTRTSDPRTPASAAHRQMDRKVLSSTSGARPLTSMAALHHDSPSNPPPRTAPPGIRTYRSSYSQGPPSATTLDEPIELGGHRTSSSLQMSSGRVSTAPGSIAGGRDVYADHRRLMLDALSMFESHLSRLPPGGQTAPTTIPEVFQNSQQAVHALDKLNDMLRVSTGKALEAQIEAEVEDCTDGRFDIAQVWADVSNAHREHLRVSDEIVRSMTQLLLGMGKILRESTPGNVTGTPQHMRSISLDEDAARRLTPEPTTMSSDKRSSDGRRSRETRRSWDPRESNQALRDRLANLTTRSTTQYARPPSSALVSPRDSGTVSSGSRSTRDGAEEQTPPVPRSLSSALASSRRLFTPRDKRIVSDTSPRNARAQALMSSLDSQETVHAHEPSPTPASRSIGLERVRALPPLAIPPSLPTLPSETLLKRAATASSALDKSARRKVSNTSNITIRAESSYMPSVIKPPNATTAISTATASNAGSSDSGGANGMTRTESGGSARSNGVTFSRPSGVSTSTLTGLQQQREPQGIRRVESNETPDPSPVSIRSPMSGSETERPRTIGVRGRYSLDIQRPGGPSQPSTLQSTRKERRRTITEIFAQANS